MAAAEDKGNSKGLR